MRLLVPRHSGLGRWGRGVLLAQSELTPLRCWEGKATGPHNCLLVPPKLWARALFRVVFVHAGGEVVEGLATGVDCGSVDAGREIRQ
jgi:hypothetical protein